MEDAVNRPCCIYKLQIQAERNKERIILFQASKRIKNKLDTVTVFYFEIAFGTVSTQNTIIEVYVLNCKYPQSKSNS